MPLTNISNAVLAATAAIAATGVFVPLTIAAIALPLVAICSIALPDARRRHALLVLDRLTGFASAVRGRSNGPNDGRGP